MWSRTSTCSAPGAWEEFARQWPAQWRALIRKFLAGQARDPARSVRYPFHAGASLPPPLPGPPALPQAPPAAEALALLVYDTERVPRDAAAAAQSLHSVCPACDAAFASAAALAVHERLRHGRKRLGHRFVIDGRCPACAGDYRSRLRCLEHLERGSRACREALLGGAGSPPTPTMCWRQPTPSTGSTAVSPGPQVSTSGPWSASAPGGRLARLVPPRLLCMVGRRGLRAPQRCVAGALRASCRLAPRRPLRCSASTSRPGSTATLPSPRNTLFCSARRCVASAPRPGRRAPGGLRPRPHGGRHARCHSRRLHVHVHVNPPFPPQHAFLASS